MDPVLVLVTALTTLGLAVVGGVVGYSIYWSVNWLKRKLAKKHHPQLPVPKLKEDILGADKIFEVHRDYMQHEDTLIFHRTTLVATIQGFLLTAFGVSVQKFYEKINPVISCNFSSVQDKHPFKTLFDLSMKVLQPETFQDVAILEFNCYLLVLVLTGISTSLIGVVSIRAAKRAITELQTHWEIYYYQGQINLQNSEFRVLPGITGGGSLKNRDRGISFVTWVPIFFVALWILILVIRTIFMVFEGMCWKFGTPVSPQIATLLGM
jgi:hypothetical protein